MYVKLHIKTKAGKGKLYKNPAAIILTYHNDNSDSGTYSRVLKQRNVSHTNLATRPCDEEEYLECAHKYRTTFIYYQSWEALINDEKKFLPSQDWLDTLEKLKLEYPQFN